MGIFGWNPFSGHDEYFTNAQVTRLVPKDSVNVIRHTTQSTLRLLSGGDANTLFMSEYTMDRRSINYLRPNTLNKIDENGNAIWSSNTYRLDTTSVDNALYDEHKIAYELIKIPLDIKAHIPINEEYSMFDGCVVDYSSVVVSQSISSYTKQIYFVLNTLLNDKHIHLFNITNRTIQTIEDNTLYQYSINEYIDAPITDKDTRSYSDKLSHTPLTQQQINYNYIQVVVNKINLDDTQSQQEEIFNGELYYPLATALIDATNEIQSAHYVVVYNDKVVVPTFDYVEFYPKNGMSKYGDDRDTNYKMFSLLPSGTFIKVLTNTVPTSYKTYFPYITIKYGSTIQDNFTSNVNKFLKGCSISVDKLRSSLNNNDITVAYIAMQTDLTITDSINAMSAYHYLNTMFGNNIYTQFDAYFSLTLPHTNNVSVMYYTLGSTHIAYSYSEVLSVIGLSSNYYDNRLHNGYYNIKYKDSNGLKKTRLIYVNMFERVDDVIARDIQDYDTLINKHIVKRLNKFKSSFTSTCFELVNNGDWTYVIKYKHSEYNKLYGTYHIYKLKNISYKLFDTHNEVILDNKLLPMLRSTADYLNNNQLSVLKDNNLTLQVIASKTVHIEWYEEKWFSDLIQAGAIVFTIVTAGAGSSTIAVAATIAETIAIQVAISVVVDYALNNIGGDIGKAIAVLAIVGGSMVGSGNVDMSSLASLSIEEQMMQMLTLLRSLTTASTTIMNDSISKELAQLKVQQAEVDKIYEETHKLTKSLEGTEYVDITNQMFTNLLISRSINTGSFTQIYNNDPYNDIDYMTDIDSGVFEYDNALDRLTDVKI